jgi:hypothetical protein
MSVLQLDQRASNFGTMDAVSSVADWFMFCRSSILLMRQRTVSNVHTTLQLCRQSLHQRLHFQRYTGSGAPQNYSPWSLWRVWASQMCKPYGD